MPEKIIVAADDLGAIRTIQASLAEQGYELVVAMRGPESPMTNAAEHTALTGKIAGEEERVNLEQRLMNAEYIGRLAQAFPGMKSEIVCHLTNMLGYMELVQNRAEKGTEVQEHLSMIEHLILSMYGELVKYELLAHSAKVAVRGEISTGIVAVFEAE